MKARRNHSFGPQILLGAIIIVISFLSQGMVPVSCYAQVETEVTQPAEYVDGAPTQVQSQLAPEDSSAPSSPPADAEDQDSDPIPNLESLLPLNALMTPLHWGRFSLLSFSAYEGYTSNPHFQRIPLGASVTSLSALVLYTSHFSGWDLDLQYHPFVWISPSRRFDSLAAFSSDLRKTQRLNNNWRWTVLDRLRYSPTQATQEQAGFVSGSGGYTFGNAFLSTGRNIFFNGVSTSLTDHYGANSSLTFQSDLAFTHLSNYIGSLPGANLPGEHAVSSSSEVMWRDHYSEASTFIAVYKYRVQVASDVNAGVQTHSADIGWNRRLTPSIGFAAAVGPAWSFYGLGQGDEGGRKATTLHGLLSLSKEFRGGGVVLEASRSDGFSGVVSNRFYNRYDFGVHRDFSERLLCSASASYIQQERSGLSNVTGNLAYVEARYRISRNWGIFGQARYLKLSGDGRFSGTEISGITGFRWSWVPDTP